MSIRFAVRPDSPYATEWSDADRKACNLAVRNEIHTKLPSAYRDRWVSVLLNVEDDGDCSDAEVAASLTREFDALNLDATGGNPEVEFQLASTTAAYVEYAFVDSIRICSHEYDVQIKPKGGASQDLEPWSFTYQPAGKSAVTVAFRAGLSAEAHAG